MRARHFQLCSEHWFFSCTAQTSAAKSRCRADHGQLAYTEGTPRVYRTHQTASERVSFLIFPNMRAGPVAVVHAVVRACSRVCSNTTRRAGEGEVGHHRLSNTPIKHRPEVFLLLYPQSCTLDSSSGALSTAFSAAQPKRELQKHGTGRTTGSSRTTRVPLGSNARTKRPPNVYPF